MEHAHSDKTWVFTISMYKTGELPQRESFLIATWNILVQFIRPD